MITYSDVEISKKIIENARSIISLTNEVNEYLKELIIINQKIIDLYNLKNLTTIDITPTEIGRFNSTVKKIATGYFKKWEGINLNIDSDKSLMYSYTILSRRLNAKKTYFRTDLEYATINLFKTEILNQLIKINT